MSNQIVAHEPWLTLAQRMGRRALYLIGRYAWNEVARRLEDEYLPALEQYSEEAQREVAQYVREVLENNDNQVGGDADMVELMDEGKSLFNLQ